MNILIVCSGNICRSPMAEAYLRHRLEAEGVSGRVSSGGTLGIIDDSAAAAAVAVMAQEVGIDISGHRTRGIRRDEVEDADVILVMEDRHRRHLATLYPSHSGKIRKITEYAPPGTGVTVGSDIFDPVGMEPEAFRTCFRILRTCLDGFMATLPA